MTREEEGTSGYDESVSEIMAANQPHLCVRCRDVAVRYADDVCSSCEEALEEELNETKPEEV